NDDCRHGFAPLLVRSADDGDGGDAEIGRDNVFDLAGEDVETPRDDHVLLAIYNRQKPVLVFASDVAGVEPVSFEGLACLLRLVPIALHHQGSPHTQFPWLALLYFLAVIVEQADTNPRHRSTARRQSVEITGIVLLLAEDADRLWALRLAIELEEDGAELADRLPEARR